MLSPILGTAQDLFYSFLFSLLFRRRRWSRVCRLHDHQVFSTNRRISKNALGHFWLLLLD
jgi:hypothetical protein